MSIFEVFNAIHILFEILARFIAVLLFVSDKTVESSDTSICF